MKSNLTVGNPMAKAQNSPGPMAKSTRSNLTVGKTMAKVKNSPAPLAKSKGSNLTKGKPMAAAHRSEDARIHGELTTGKRSNSHNRGGR